MLDVQELLEVVCYSKELGRSFKLSGVTKEMSRRL
jgi:hypothetical protein